MTTAAPRFVLAAGGMIVIGAITGAWQISDFLAHPLAISSSSGLRVFRDGDQLVSYPDFLPGVGPIILVAGFTLLALAVFVAAVTWPGRRAGHPPRR